MSFDLSLREVLAERIYGNPVSLWLIAAAVFVASFAVLLVVRHVVTGRLARLAARTQTAVDDLLVDIFRRTRPVYLLVLTFCAASLFLTLPEGVRQGIRYAAVLAVALQAARWGNGIIKFWTDRISVRRGTDAASATSATTVMALSYVARGALFLLLLLLALDNLGINITALITGLGIGGIAVALAVQNILSDLFGALTIVLDKPFQVGDAIVVDTVEGTIEHVGLKSTRVRASSGEQVIVPNANLLQSRIRNFQRLVERRAVMRLRVAYGTPPETIERIPAMLREIVSAQEQVRFDRSHFTGIGDSSLDFETVYFVTSSDYALFMNTQQAIYLAVLRRFRGEGVELALPTRAVVERLVAGDGQSASGGGASTAVAGTAAA